MKKFLKKVVCFVILIIISSVIFAVYENTKSKRSEQVGSDVIYAIELAQEHNNYRKVLIGDSVCHQLFQQENQNENEEVCYLGTNQAVTVVGNYILLENYLKNNPQTEKVIYFAGPQSFANDMWLNHTYQYFILYFYNKENMQYVDVETQEMLESRFGKKYRK